MMLCGARADTVLVAVPGGASFMSSIERHVLMSRPVGRHRASRPTGIRALRRPAVVATAAISAVSVSAAGYASAAGASAHEASGTAQVPTTADAAVGAADAAVTADAAAQTRAFRQAVQARAAAAQRTDTLLEKRRSAATQRRKKAESAATAKRHEVAAAKKKAAAAAAARKEAAKKAAAKKAAARKAATQRAERAQTPSTSRDTSRPPVAQASGGSPQAIASSMLSAYGWGQDQMGCLTALWNKESGWNVYATNPSSGAYGIPQSLPGSKMASAGADWRTNPATQIRWGLGYIRSSYGSPCGAWGHSQATGWY